MKILEIIHFYDVDELYRKIKNGYIYPRHHIWCYDHFLYGKHLVKNVWTKRKKKGPSVLSMSNWAQQEECYAFAKNYDVIFAPFLFDVYFLALLRCLHLLNTPIVTIAQDTWSIKYSNSIKNKLGVLLRRFIARHGIDRLAFISEHVYDKCSYYFTDKKQAFPLFHWGVDLSYYDNYAGLQPEPKANYFFMTGGNNRDVDVIIRAGLLDAENLIYIQTRKLGKIEKNKLSSNIMVDDTPKEEKDLLDGYYNSLAVLVPLKKDTGSMSGITVVYEGMALGKPIISTRTPYYPFDIEKEECGIYVDEGDIKGWVNAMNFLRNNPNISKRMGEKSRMLVETRFNYKLFCEEIQNVIESVSQKS